MPAIFRANFSSYKQGLRVKRVRGGDEGHGGWWSEWRHPFGISACACSAWRDLTRLGELTRLKPFTWEKVGSPPRVTLSRQPSDPTPQGHITPRARFAVSHVNGRRLFISNCRKTWLAPVGSGGEGASGPQANFSPYKQGLTGKWDLPRASHVHNTPECF